MATGESGKATSLRWYDPEFAGDRTRAEACIRWIRRISTRTEMRERICLLNAVHYDDFPALGLGPYAYASFDAGSEQLKLNLIKAVTDTYVSLIARSKPKPQALTSDGEWSLKKKAKGLTRWWEGKAADCSLYQDVSDPACLQSAVYGLGLAKVYREYPNLPKMMDVGVELTFPWELRADDAEWQTPKKARNLGQRKVYDRTVLAEMFPSEKSWILKNAPRLSQEQGSMELGADSASDLVPVYELWHLESYPGCGDGLHVIMVEGKTLYEGTWDRPRFPFALLYRTRPTQGLWGMSIPHEIRGLQIDINQTLVDMQECLRLYGKPRLIAPSGSIDPNMWSDETDEYVFYNGQQPPIVYSPQVMPPEQYNFLLTKWQKGFEVVGVSQEASQGQIPEGLSGSGASIRAWNDVQDGRMYKPSQNFEDFHMQIAELMIDEARDIAKVRKDYCSVYRGKTYVQLVNFRDVDPGKDAYYLRTYPVSRLSNSPAQRLAQLQELFNAKVIDAEAFREMLEFPDLEAEDNLMNSPRELAEKLIDRFLEADDPDDPDIFVYPEPEWPLAQMKLRFQYAEIRARLDDAPEGNCRLLRNFMALCDQAQAKAQAALAPPAPGPGALPPGPPPPNVASLPPGTLSPQAGPNQPVLQ